MRIARLAIWLPLGALVVLGARALCYALAPATPLAADLQHRTAGPALPVVAGGSLVAALIVSSAVVWLASLAVRERHLLSGDAGPAPRFDLRRLALSAAGLWVASSVAFAGVESYVHMRTGLGWHGVTCLAGPVHRNAVPILAALALLAAVLHAAAAHVVAWARRTVRLLRMRRTPRLCRPAAPLPLLVTALRSALSPRPLGARGPPLAAQA